MKIFFSLVVVILIGVVVASCTKNQENKNARYAYFTYKGSDMVYDIGIDRQKQYFNPIIAGFYPDPSICRKGDTYYLVNSTFGVFPGVPIFSSTDLVNWEQIGHVLDRPSQLNLDGLGMSHGIFAPAIEYNPYNDTFYMVTTSVYGIGNFYVKTQDPSVGWSDPILLPQVTGIDPSFYFDDDGKAYIVECADPFGGPDWNGQRAIHLHHFDVQGDSIIGSPIEIIRGGAKPEDKPIWVEGPHMYKVKGFYFLMAAEGGTSTDHSEVIFRSKSPVGPYKSYKNNPILTQRDLSDNRDNKVTSTGHADIIETANGEWWAVFLGCRPYVDNLVNTGRETFLLPVEWVDGWPVILQKGKQVPLIGEKNDLVQRDIPPTSGNFKVVDAFDSPELDLTWVHIRTPRNEFYTIGNGELVITPLPLNIEDNVSPSALLRRQQHLNFEVETKLSFTPGSDADFAGLTLFQNEEFHFVFGKTRIEGVESLIVKRVQKDAKKLTSIELNGRMANSALYLKIVGRGRYCDFLYSTDGIDWKTILADADATNLSTQHAGGFIGTLLGPYATSDF